MSGYDDDEWVGGVPPEGHHTRDQAQPAFWWRTRPAQLGFAGLLVLIVVLVLVVALAGCGAGGSGSGHAGAGGAQARAQQSPGAVLDATRDALKHLHSYHVRGSSVDRHGASHMSADVTDTGSMRFTVVDGASRFTVIAAGGQTYLKGGRAFWLHGNGAQGPAMARLFTGRWVKMPPAASQGLRKDARQLLPGALAYCLSRDLGTLENLGARDAHGKPVVVIRDKGDKPGTSPGELSVPASGAALPVLVRQTGPRRPGGGKRDPRCQNANDTTTQSESVLTHFNDVAPIQAPQGALDLNALGAGAGLGTPA
jgi:hypothetical protein